MHDLFKEMERVCERSTKELHEFLDRIEQNKNTISPADLDILCKLVDIAKNSKSTMKKIYEIEDMEQMDREYSGNMYSGNMMYRNEPMWDRRYSGANNGNGGNYSGNSYRGTYTVESGGDYSGRRGMNRGYSRNSEKESMRNELEDMLQDSRDDREAEVIKKLMARL